jgi:IPT/TIG domain
MSRSPRARSVRPAEDPTRHAPRREGTPPDERGAVLILALLFLIIGVVAVGALAFQVTNDVTNSTHFRTVRSLQYAAKSSTNLAIQNIRYTPLLATSQTLNASPPAACWGTSPESELASIDGEPAMASWCTTVWTPTSANTRTVTISTCLATVSAANCAASPMLQAVVSFDDYPPQEASAPSSTPCALYCGTSMVTNSWVWSPVVPTVSGISPSSGPITGGTSVTITGSGFVPGSTVSFVEESGGTPASDNTVLVVPAANVTYNSTTSLTALAPAMIEGSTYYVTVTTLKGTSAQSGSDVFTYAAVAPVISAISPNVGSIAGGNSVTITGTAFVSNVLVKFIQESGGTPVSGGVTVSCHVGLPPCQVNVLSSTSMTVVTPGIVTGTTYFITVATPYGLSPTSGNDIFTFSPLVPTVSAVSPGSGPDAGGTAIVITGTGFVNGATVSFIKESTGCGGFGAISANNVVIQGSQTITATSPSVSSAQPYYVYVTTPSGPSSCYPVFTYTG